MSITEKKNEIIKIAWSLFKEKGFEKTTIQDILERANISKGTFYRYFDNKDALLETLADVLDDYHIELSKKIDPNMNSLDKLIMLCYEAHKMIERKIDFELLCTLYSSQAGPRGYKPLVNPNRYNVMLVRQIVEEGQQRGQISKKLLPNFEIERYFFLCARAIIYDYCISEASYSLGEYTRKVLPLMLQSLRGEES